MSSEKPQGIDQILSDFESGIAAEEAWEDAEKEIQALITEARKEGRMQMGEKINKYAERADFFQPDAEVVLASTMVWLSGLNEKENK